MTVEMKKGGKRGARGYVGALEAVLRHQECCWDRARGTMLCPGDTQFGGTQKREHLWKEGCGRSQSHAWDRRFRQMDGLWDEERKWHQ